MVLWKVVFPDMVLCEIVFPDTEKLIMYLYQSMLQIMRIKIIDVICSDEFKSHSHIKSNHMLQLRGSSCLLQRPLATKFFHYSGSPEDHLKLNHKDPPQPTCPDL